MKKLLICFLAVAAYCNAYCQSLSDAQQALEGEQYEKARTLLENLVKAEPLLGENYFHLGSLYLTLGDDSLAIATFQKGIRQKKEGNLSYIGLGQYFLDEEKPDSATKYFDKAMEKVRKKDTKELMYIARAYTKSYKPSYAKAAEYAQRAITIDPKLAQAYLVLGDAQLNLGNPSGAYSAYRNAYDYDNTLLRAQLHLAIITKNARSFNEAATAVNNILATNPSYGPAYRELAEIYYLWSLVESNQRTAYIDKALGYYKQYLGLTDQSLNSRMRYADFLILAKDYEALEKEAQEMQKLDEVNPRIFRYLGYSACENGNFQEAIKALNEFMAKVEPKRVVGLDYLYLARAQKSLAVMPDSGKIADSAMFEQMLVSLSKAIVKEAVIDNEFGELGITFFKEGDYENATRLFDVLIASPTSTLLNKLYFANSVFYDVANMDSAAQAKHQAIIIKADTVYNFVAEHAPMTQDVYFNRARLNRYIVSDSSGLRTEQYFTDYIRVVSTKPAEMANKRVHEKLSEAYTSIGAYYAETDKAKAIENFTKALEFDPANEHADRALRFLNPDAYKHEVQQGKKVAPLPFQKKAK
jgi:tetratricopeptide (TPR) repeat protein